MKNAIMQIDFRARRRAEPRKAPAEAIYEAASSASAPIMIDDVGGAGSGQVADRARLRIGGESPASARDHSRRRPA